LGGEGVRPPDIPDHFKERWIERRHAGTGSTGTRCSLIEWINCASEWEEGAGLFEWGNFYLLRRGSGMISEERKGTDYHMPKLGRSDFWRGNILSWELSCFAI